MKKSLILLFVIFLSKVCFSQFTLPALPYSYESLELSFDKETMRIHHDKHHDSYVTQLNKQVEANAGLKNKSVEEICKTISKFNVQTRNNAGGHYNHSLFWTILSPKSSLPSGTLMDEIIKAFGSFENFKSQFSDSAKTRFGSGWAWLIMDTKGKLKITTTANQDNPLMDIAVVKGTPILGLDVWEHAYYLKYQNKRVDYIAAFWNIVNWEEVNRRFKEKY